MGLSFWPDHQHHWYKCIAAVAGGSLALSLKLGTPGHNAMPTAGRRVGRGVSECSLALSRTWQNMRNQYRVKIRQKQIV